jgi:hypothetical protein
LELSDKKKVLKGEENERIIKNKIKIRLSRNH